MRNAFIRIGILVQAGIVVSLLALMSLDSFAESRIITTCAGPLLPANGALAATQGIDEPASVAADGTGGFYVVSMSQNRVYRVSASGALSLVAGNGILGFGGDGGPATSAQLSLPSGVAVDAAGNLFIADLYNQRIRKATPGGVIYTVAGNGSSGYGGDGGPATSAQLNYANGVVVDAAGNLFIADTHNQRIRKVTPGGVISTLAGNGASGYSGDGGPATSAQLNYPYGVAVDAAGNLFIADYYNHRIRKVTAGGVISTVAGNGTPGYSGDGGPATSAQLSSPSEVAVDAAGNLFIADHWNHCVRKVTPAGVISTAAGNGTSGYSGDGGPATSAQLHWPMDAAVDPTGNLFIADTQNNRVRKVTPGGLIDTAAGNGTQGFSGDGGPATSALLRAPHGVTPDAAGNLFFTDWGNNRIRKVTPGGVIGTIAGTGTPGSSGDGGPATSAQINGPWGIASDAAGNLFFAEYNNNRIRRVTPGGVISTVAGTGGWGDGGDGGPATSAWLANPSGIAMDAAGNVFIADTNNHRIRKVTPGGVISTVAGDGTSGFSGDGGPATSARIHWPVGVAVDRAGNLFVADQGNYRVRKVTPAGIISTVAGNGIFGFSGDGGPATSAMLKTPYGLGLDASGNLFIADLNGQRVRKVTPGGVISTVAGNGMNGFSGDGGPATSAQLYAPRAVAIDAAGNMFIGDTNNGRIRKLSGPRPAGDTDADGKTDIALWRQASGIWYVLPSGSPGAYTGVQWGTSTDIPVPGDFDGDGKADYAVWRPSSGSWFVLPSNSPPGTSVATQWGISTDRPVPADYDGDGKIDCAVWRPSDGVWYIVPSGAPSTFRSIQWGVSSDIPVPADYDGDGKADLGVWRPSTGAWYIMPSGSPGSFTSGQWGISTDKPVPADYDGDGKTDIAVWRPGDGTWYVLPSGSPGSFTARPWGVPTDIPVAGDYDGDGKNDIAVWRPGSGTWFIVKSSDPGNYTSTQWGVASDVPISALTTILRQTP